MTPTRISLLRQMAPGVFAQVTNVACLPGIVRAALRDVVHRLDVSRRVVSRAPIDNIKG